MGANKITLNTPDGEEVLMDLTGDTVTPETLAEGVTAHDASGEPIVGTMKPEKSTVSVSVDHINDSEVTYFAENGTKTVAPTGTQSTIEALNGAVWFNNNAIHEITGEYVSSLVGSDRLVLFKEDGGGVTVGSNIRFAAEIIQRTISVPYVNDRITSIPRNKFNACRQLPKVDFAKVSYIEGGAFNNTGPGNGDGSVGLVTVILRNTETVCALQGSGAFGGWCPVNKGLGYIYVPKTMADGSDGVTAYRNATNWSTYANQIRAIEDYPEICGGE